MTQHNRAGGPAGPEDDDDYGPPDWFAAVAEPDPESDPEPYPEPPRTPAWGARPATARRPESGRKRGAGPSSADAPGTAGPAGLDGGLGLVSASELPTGRRRRRSALAEEETPGHRAGEEAAGHGGAAAFPATSAATTASTAGAGGRRARTRTRTDRAGRTAGRAAGPWSGPDEDAGDGPGELDDGSGGTGRAEKPRRAARAARAEEQADPETRARDICLRLLTGAAKSRKQLADALRKREVPDEVAEQVLTRLEEVGLIDDEAFARAWVESRHAVRGLSRRALAQELRTKGVTGEPAERALAQLDQDDETEAARALVERKLQSTRGLERQVRTRRLVGVLARRGYAEGLAFRVVREALGEEAAGAGPEEEDVDGAPADAWD
ncbi:RecX family transcriptional regulator [Kitasatospora sp. NPDC047058]|uniref:regulatory protein RecX n=1 Tax=Kitasatospora sp. NPDC047058 TaxID=3155620 RepID=UPI0033EDE2D9